MDAPKVERLFALFQMVDRRGARQLPSGTFFKILDRIGIVETEAERMVRVAHCRLSDGSIHYGEFCSWLMKPKEETNRERLIEDGFGDLFDRALSTPTSMTRPSTAASRPLTPTVPGGRPSSGRRRTGSDRRAMHTPMQVDVRVQVLRPVSAGHYGSQMRYESKDVHVHMPSVGMGNDVQVQLQSQLPAHPDHFGSQGGFGMAEHEVCHRRQQALAAEAEQYHCHRLPISGGSSEYNSQAWAEPSFGLPQIDSHGVSCSARPQITSRPETPRRVGSHMTASESNRVPAWTNGEPSQIESLDATRPARPKSANRRPGSAGRPGGKMISGSLDNVSEDMSKSNNQAQACTSSEPRQLRSLGGKHAEEKAKEEQSTKNKAATEETTVIKERGAKEEAAAQEVAASNEQKAKQDAAAKEQKAKEEAAAKEAAAVKEQKAKEEQAAKEAAAKEAAVIKEQKAKEEQAAKEEAAAKEAAAIMEHRAKEETAAKAAAAIMEQKVKEEQAAKQEAAAIEAAAVKKQKAKEEQAAKEETAAKEEASAKETAAIKEQKAKEEQVAKEEAAAKEAAAAQEQKAKEEQAAKEAAVIMERRAKEDAAAKEEAALKDQKAKEEAAAQEAAAMKEQKAKEEQAAREEAAAKEVAAVKDQKAKEEQAAKVEAAAKETAAIKEQKAKEEQAAKEEAAAKEAAAIKEHKAKEEAAAKEAAAMKAQKAKEEKSAKEKETAKELAVVQEQKAQEQKAVSITSPKSTAAAAESPTAALEHLGNNVQFLKASIKTSKAGPLESQEVLTFLEKKAGLSLSDPRLLQQVKMLKSWETISEDRAKEVLSNSLIRKALKFDLAIQDFPKFVETCTGLYHDAAPNEGGGVATYIPQLARQNPDLWGVSMCSIDGQQMNIGDCDIPFCVQSTSKPITYCVALEINGEEKVHEHVGREPSGLNFNDRSLMQRDAGKCSIPHNPCINAGAIMTSSLVKMDVSEWDRFTYVMGIWERLAGGTKPSFQNDTFMGERSTASRNFCLAYMMEEEQAFPCGTDIQKTLEAYFSWCSIEVTAQSMACVAATLANGGICPLTNERIFTNETVTSCLSIMMSCGMYDFSGQFAFEIGFPAKSGVSGVLCVVIPRICGFATFSPRLDKLGNSVRGIDFCQRLAKRYPFHVFSLTHDWENWCPSRGIPTTPKTAKRRSSAFNSDDGMSAKKMLQDSLNKQQEEKKKKGEKNEQNAKKTIANLFGGDPEILMKNAMSSWKKVVGENKKLKVKFGGKLLARFGKEKKLSVNTAKDSSQKKEKEEGEEDDDGNFLWEASTSLWWSAYLGDEQRIRQLAANGIDVSLQDYDSRSALHLAASEGHDRLVQLLISLRADINAKDLHGHMPIEDATREHKHSTKRILQHAARNQRETNLLLSLNQEIEPSLFSYFSGKSVVGQDDVHRVLKSTLTETLDSCGLTVDDDPRFTFLEDFPAAFTSTDLKEIARAHPIIARALKGRLVVPNFTLMSERFGEIFSETLKSIQTHEPHTNFQEKEALTVMTVDGQRLHLGASDEYLCAGDLISIVIFAVSTELLGLEMVMQHVAAEPSGKNSNFSILNGDKMPYNSFMWNGMLTLLSLLEEKCGDAKQVIEKAWAKLCQGNPKQCDEAWMQQDKENYYHRVSVLLHTSLDLRKFPSKTPPAKVMEVFFHLRAIKTSIQDLGSIGATLANRGRHPLKREQVFKPETVKDILSMMYSAGCNAQSGEFSFRVGVPAKSSSEGAVLLVLPNVMGLCIVSPQVNHNEVSIGGMKFCEIFGSEFNCHILSGTASSAGKEDLSAYHMHSDNELCQQLMFAASKGDIMTLSALNQLGFDLDYKDYDKRTAAHMAAGANQISVIEYLKKKGVDMQCKDRWGCSPYDEAKRCGHHKAACVLQESRRTRCQRTASFESGEGDTSDNESDSNVSVESKRQSSKSQPRRNSLVTAAKADSLKGKRDSQMFRTLQGISSANEDVDEDLVMGA